MLTKKQLQARKNGIGGSDIAKILGVSSYGGPLDLYHEKLNELVDNSNDENVPAEIGNELETYLCKKYTKRTGKKVLQVDTIHHQEYPFLFANVDGVIEDNGILECKCVTHRQFIKWGDEGTFDIPDPYKLQVAYYASIANAPYADIIVNFGNLNIGIYRYERNLRFEEIIIEKAKDFWVNHVIPKIPPKPLTPQETFRNYGPLETHKDSIKHIDGPHYSSYENLIYLTKQKKELDEKIEQEKAKLCLFLEKNEVLIDSENKVLATYKSYQTERFDSILFKEKEPLKYNEYLKKTKTRRFLFKE